jgi:hypothetical protein
MTLPFVDKRYFLTVTQVVLPLHALADPAPATDPSPATTEPTTAPPLGTSCLGV